MTERTLGNVTAIWLRDESRRPEMLRRLRPEGGQVDERAGWLVLSKSLAGSEPTVVGGRGEGDAFAIAVDDTARVLRDRSGQDALLSSIPAHIAALEGDVTAAVLGRDGSATLVRSLSGRVPMFYATCPDWTFVTTRVRHLRDLLPDGSDPDWFVYAVWQGAGQHFPDDRAFYSDTYAVPPGSLVRVGPTEPSSRKTTLRSVEPRAEESPVDRISALREALLRNLERELQPSGNLLLLSGGVDSSALAALAAGELGYGVTTLSLMPIESGPLYDRERWYIDRLRRTYEFEESLELRVDATAWLRTQIDAPDTGCPVQHPLLAPVAALRPQGTLFTGWSADEIVGSDRLTLPDWARSTSPWSLVKNLRHADRFPGGRRHAIKNWFEMRRHERRIGSIVSLAEELPLWALSRYRDDYRSWLARYRRQLGRPSGGRWQLWRDLEMGDGFLVQTWEVLSEADVLHASPYLSRDLIEQSARCGVDELIAPSTKRILRAAMVGLMPEENRRRLDRGIWLSDEVQWYPYPVSLPAELGSVVEPSHLDRAAGSIDFDDAGALFGLANALVPDWQPDMLVPRQQVQQMGPAG